MVVEYVFSNLVDFSELLFSNVIEVPEAISGPLVEVPYALLILLAIFVITTIISRFVNLKRSIYLVFIDLIAGFIFGGFYIMVLIFVLNIPVLFFVKFFKRGEEGLDTGSELDLGTPEKSKPEIEEPKTEPEEFKLPEGESDIGDSGTEEFSFDKSKETQPTQPKEPTDSKQKLCPYCGMPLAYIPKYRRYYCYKCGKYV